MCIFHKWSKWNKTEEGNLTIRNSHGSKVRAGVYYILERTCIKCNKKQIEAIKAYA